MTVCFFFCQRFFFRAGVAGMEPGGVVIKKLMASMHRKREIEAQILTKTVFYLFIYHLLFIYIHVLVRKREAQILKSTVLYLLIYSLLFIYVRRIEAQILKSTILYY